MALRPLHPPVKEALKPGWDILATEAGRTGRGIKATLHILNSEPKACQSFALGYTPEQNQFAEAVYTLCGVDDVTVKALLPRLAYAIEDVLRKMAETHASDNSLQGQPFTFEDIEPWDSPVDGVELLNDIRDVYTRFAVLPPGAADVLALWTEHTYTIEISEVTPYIDVSSPVKGCGKTRVVEIAYETVYRPVETVNATTAAIFRLIDKWEPTPLIDEQDSFLAEHNELRGVLNAGYKRGAMIPRVVGDNQEVRQFKTFCPKMIAGIGQLPPTLRDRSIQIVMEKKGNQKLPKWTRKRRAELVSLRRRCLRWAQDHMQRLSDIEPSMPESLTDRAEEIWEPLLQIADAVGGEWPTRALQAVALLQGKDITTDDVRIQLLSDLRDIFATRVRIPSDELPKLLHPLEDRPWAEYGRRNPKPITKGQIQTVLRSFGIKAKQFREGEDRRSGYEKNQFLKVFDQYLG